ncbi:MAG TPA: hypothetical protein PK544_12365 [Spirochaetota bacterium]|nr:hypothetical protein [Spirochaetota bacterium]
MRDVLDNRDIIIPLTDNNAIQRGAIIRRVGNGKDQQGCFMNYDDSGDMILVNVIDIHTKSFLARAGILKIKEGDTVYRYNSTFGEDPLSGDAEALVREWPLFKKNEQLRESMLYFVKTAFSPRLILYMKKMDCMDYLFVPLQQKFKIGRFTETVDWDVVRKESFREKLSSLKTGEHLTYIAMIPQIKSYSAFFYSIGTKPHQETQMSLRSEPFNFVPTHGGHIKASRSKKDMKEFIVDAGSNFLGKGTKASLKTAKEITDAMKRTYKEYNFIPIEGRGAFGEEQSY